MLCCTVLCCDVLCPPCDVLCCAVLCFAALCCAERCSTVVQPSAPRERFPRRAMLYNAMVDSTALYCTVLYYTAPNTNQLCAALLVRLRIALYRATLFRFTRASVRAVLYLFLWRGLCRPTYQPNLPYCCVEVQRTTVH
jgi:hypothetical protein